MASPFVSKDGSKHTNRDTMKRADARFASRQPQPGPGSADAGADDGFGGDDDDQAQDGAAMAAQHGPAVEINVQHNHEAGSHSVHAKHPDGYEHETPHGSADEAHQYAADVAGVGGDTGAMGGGF